MDILQHSKLYNAYYYTHSSTGQGSVIDRVHDEVWLGFFKSVADHIVDEINPKSVLDVGCAMGLLVAFLRKREVEAFGLDISEYAIQNIHPDAKPFCWIGSGTDPLPRKFELVVCIEVLEHLPHIEAEKAIENLCRCSDDVLFSSTPFDYKEGTHFNVQPPEYWVEAFARQGFLRDLDFDASFITPWAIKFCRQRKPVERLVREYERKFFNIWKENIDLRYLVLEMQQTLASNEQTMSELNNRLSQKEKELQENLAVSISSNTSSNIIDRIRNRCKSYIQDLYQRLAK
jgi:SAM-dependent methyltransferase